MIAPLYNVVLATVMVVQNSSGQIQINYESFEYYDSMPKCRQEVKKKSKVKNKKIQYVCLKVYKE